MTHAFIRAYGANASVVEGGQNVRHECKWSEDVVVAENCNGCPGVGEA